MALCDQNRDMDRRQLIDRKHAIQAEFRRVRRERDRLHANGGEPSRLAALERQLAALGAEEQRLRRQIDQAPGTATGNVVAMSWFKKLISIIRGEASDVREGLSNVGKALDDELARKERELAASPEERIDMILEENAAADERFAELEDKIRDQSARPTAEAETEDADGAETDAE